MQMLSLDLDKRGVKDKLPADFFYIHEDHYLICNLERPGPGYGYLYTDGATSCIIAVLEGYNRENVPQVLMSHLVKPYSFRLFARLISKHFTGPVCLYARGANPPHNKAAGANRFYFTELFAALTPERAGSIPFQITQMHLELGSGDPRLMNRGCLGIDLAARRITSQAFMLDYNMRNKSGYLNTLFTLFNLSPGSLWNAGKAYPAALIKRLRAAASVYNWQEILALPDTAILERFSTTPEYEPPWFVENIRQLGERIPG